MPDKKDKLNKKGKEFDEELIEIEKEMQILNEEAKQIESNATAKILMVLSQGWHQSQEAVVQQPTQQQIQLSVEQLGYRKVNGSIILTLG